MNHRAKMIREICEAAEDAGWRVERSGHIKCYSPDGASIVTTSSTPSDHRSVLNFRSRMRRAGLKV